MADDTQADFDVAIIGLACRFPGANDIEQYWSNLTKGVESVTTFTRTQLIDAGLPASLVDHPDFVKAAPVIEQAARFDAALFGYSPREAKLIDPQQRHLLELSWAALEHAGYDASRFEGRIGTYAGVAMNTYLLQSGLVEHFYTNYLDTLLASDKDFLATRIAYKLGLTGPAITVQTACSTSLVLTHLACQSLLNHESDMALAAAASIRAPLANGHLYEEGSVFSKDAHCRPFDADTSGTLFGSGAAVIVLKRLTDALNDQDNIWAVIKGSAINNDGSTKSDFTAPGTAMQSDVVSEALASADITADSISYVEAHGTGTRIGDHIEVEALSRAFRHDTQRTGFCGLGSVKSNIGHLDVAAGLAGLTKTVLALHHRQIPATINFNNLNPQIPLERSPFRIQDKLEQWQAPNQFPRRAGVTALGMGGTNAHVILEEAPERTHKISTSQTELIVLSGHTESALLSNLTNLKDFCNRHPTTSISDIAFTLQEGRQALRHRTAIIASSASELASAISQSTDFDDHSKLLTARQAPLPRKRIFMFPGQGTQYINMGRQLYDTDTTFKANFDDCAHLFNSLLEIDLAKLVFPDSETAEDIATQSLAQTRITQPALFSIEYAYARLLQASGVQADALIGHSIGEYVAATLSGVFELNVAISIVACRANLMQQAPGGAMLAVNLNSTQTKEYLGEELDIATINSPDMTVVGGPHEAIAALNELLNTQAISCKQIAISHAFHTRSMREARDAFEIEMRKHTLSKPSIPFISNVSGSWISDAQATNPQYWADHITHTVRFSDGIKTLASGSPAVFIEVGPGNTLSSLVTQHSVIQHQHLTVCAGRRQQSQIDEYAQCLGVSGILWSAGATVDWRMRRHSSAKRVVLPTYAFEGDELWLSNATKPDANQQQPIDSWIWRQEFTQAPALFSSHLAQPTADGPDSRFLIVGGETALSRSLAETLEKRHNNVSVRTDRIGNTKSRDHYQNIFRELEDDAVRPRHIIFTVPENIDETNAQRAFLELIHLAQALTAWEDMHQINLCVMTHNALPLDVDSPQNVYASMLTACVQTITREWPHIQARHIDLVNNTLPSTDTVLAEIHASESSSPVGISDSQRWTSSLAQVKLPDLEENGSMSIPSCSDTGCTVIVGAFGGIGTLLTRSLAEQPINLALLSRSDDDQHQTLLAELENMPATINCQVADLTDAASVEVALLTIEKKFGSIGTVYHLGGLFSPALLTQKSDLDLLSILDPKITGTVTLFRALKRFAKTKLVLFSSTSAINSTEGLADYATANAFQMAFAQATPDVIAIAWPSWQDTGMTNSIPSKALRESANTHGIPVKEAISLLPRLLAADFDAIVISPTKLELEAHSTTRNKSTRSTSLEVTKSKSQSTIRDLPQRELLSEKIIEHWSRLLGYDVDQIRKEDNFFDLGGSSLLAVKLFARLEREFGVRMPTDLIIGAPTVDSLTDVITPLITNSPATATTGIAAPIVSTSKPERVVEVDTSVQLGSTDNLVLFNSGDNSLPGLFLIHPHGGAVLLYRKLATHLSAQRSIWGFQSAGVRGQADNLKTIELMAAAYILQMKTQQPQGPYFIGGYCMGGTISWEMARQLESRGEKVGGVFMLDSPHLNYPVIDKSKHFLARLLLPYVDIFKTALMRPPSGSSRVRLIYREFAQLLKRKIGRMAIDVDLDVLTDLQRSGGDETYYLVQRINRNAFERYEPGPLDSPISFYPASHQSSSAITDPTLGYDGLATGATRVSPMTGTYYFDFEEFDLVKLAASMEADMNAGIDAAIEPAEADVAAHTDTK